MPPEGTDAAGATRRNPLEQALKAAAAARGETLPPAKAAGSGLREQIARKRRQLDELRRSGAAEDGEGEGEGEGEGVGEGEGGGDVLDVPAWAVEDVPSATVSI